MIVMAVAEARKMEKTSEGGTTSAWVASGMGWAPRKLAELKTFFAEVRSELKKVTWPSKPEVKNTTLVVILTTVFFGFYLWGLDVVFTAIFARVMGSR
jgi:preprotein translocase subunit SecE